MMLRGALKTEPAHARVAAANQRTLEREGCAPVLAVLEAIAHDRAASYKRAGVTPPPWDSPTLR
jgi:hypothetical protein